MELTFAPNGNLQIDNAMIIFKNFEGRADKYNREGSRNFALLIDSQELADCLLEDKNEYGVPWNVKIKAPREEGETPFIYLPVKVSFKGRGPHIYLVSGGKKSKLDEESVAVLDDISIRYVNMDIRPYDDEINGKPFRSAYLSAMEVVQEIDRFAMKYAEEESPEE